MRWVHEHMSDLRDYQGMWIAVVDRRVVSAGTSVSQILEDVREKGLSRPFVARVPDDVDRKTYLIG
jgi:hypothetical protein